MKCCINGVNFIKLLLLFTELFKFEIQKCGQIFCAHKPYFLMPGHICVHEPELQGRAVPENGSDVHTLTYMCFTN